MIRKRFFLYVVVILLLRTLCFANNDSRQYINLEGIWNFELDRHEVGIKEQYWDKDLGEQISLPGTTDLNKKGDVNTNKTETDFLSRLFKYEGVAWYSKEVTIPAEWKNKRIFLFLERTRPTMLWINGEKVGECNYISTPHRYEITDNLVPGINKITIRVDNGKSIPQQVRKNSHACTEATQTNWNGIIGRIELEAVNKEIFIKDVQVYPNAAKRMAKIKVQLSDIPRDTSYSLSISAKSFNSSKKHCVDLKEISLNMNSAEYEFEYFMGDKALLWSDINPALYKLKVKLGHLDEVSVTFGLRDFKVNEHHFTINDIKTFLRGKHDGCVFPLTGHTPMELEEWRRYFRILKDYGLNHCRFHSWCPPKACFEAADLEGVFLQVELPFWGSYDKKSQDLFHFLLTDGDNIMHEYSNHASFVMFALGNELFGEVDIMKSLLEHFRSMESRHLYTYGSNVFLGTKGHIAGEDFLVTCRVGEDRGYSTHVRASFSYADADEGGYLNNTYPNTNMNFDKILGETSVPVIGHETGQFQIYPNYKEISKYKGVLAPWNLQEFRSRLDKQGMLDQAEEFFKSSGAWAVELYRADIEMNLRSKLMGGFQLLDLQDYPGQGSAYVGILDAFMDSKGLITPEKWREFCSEVVPLLNVNRYCWTSGEIFDANIEVANYGGTSLYGKKIIWRLQNESEIFAKGEASIPDGIGLLEVNKISLPLPYIKKACKAELLISIVGTHYKNSYPLWIYPKNVMPIENGIKVVRHLSQDVLDTLRAGGKILWMPNKEDCESMVVGGLFQTDYWNYRMFKSVCEHIKKPVSPGTLGILTDPKHPVFEDFPTESHTNWQWYSIVKNSFPLILDSMPKNYRPIIQVIDNIERNHKLGLLFEFKVDGGKLLVCMADLEKAASTPEGKQFYISLLEYMTSTKFNPETVITIDFLKGILQTNFSQKNEIKELNNISYD